MKRIFTIALAFVLSAGAAVSVYAQQNNLRTAYFLDGYTYNYKLNPALAPERGFFAVPAVGNLGIGLESNLALSTFLYPTSDGKMMTFLDDRVSSDTFLNKLNKRNLMNANTNISLIAFGFRTGKCFHTLDLSAKANINANLPKDLFAFIKTGTENGASSWDISNAGIHADTYLELAYGFSRSVGESFRVGGRLKFLMGYAMADVNIDKLQLTMSDEQWSATAHGKAEISGPIKVGTEPGSNAVDFSQIEVDDSMEGLLSPLTTHRSYGAALDLGVTYDFLKYFTASVSVLDLGMIKWNNTTQASTPDYSWAFDGFGEIDINSDNTISDQLSQMGEELTEVLVLEKTGDGMKVSRGVHATVHAGLEVRMPFYQRLSFGVLGSHRFNGPYSWTEGRVSANLAPVNFFSLAASYAISNFGSSLGGVVNIHFPGLNIYAGVDSYKPLLNVTPQFIPIDSMNTNVVLGINFSFGKAVGRYRKPRD